MKGEEGQNGDKKRNPPVVPLVLAVVGWIHAECLLWEGREANGGIVVSEETPRVSPLHSSVLLTHWEEEGGTILILLRLLKSKNGSN